MVQPFGNVDIKPWIGKLQHDFVLGFLIGMTNKPKIQRNNCILFYYSNAGQKPTEG